MERLAIEGVQLEIEHRGQFHADTLPFDARLQRDRLRLERDQRLAEFRLERARLRVSDLEPLVQRGLTSVADLDQARDAVRRQEQALELNDIAWRRWEHRAGKPEALQEKLDSSGRERRR